MHIIPTKLPSPTPQFGFKLVNWIRSWLVNIWSSVIHFMTHWTPPSLSNEFSSDTVTALYRLCWPEVKYLHKSCPECRCTKHILYIELVIWKCISQVIRQMICIMCVCSSSHRFELKATDKLSTTSSLLNCTIFYTS